MVTKGGRDGHGRRMGWSRRGTGWSRKVDGMVTEGGREAVKNERFTVVIINLLTTELLRGYLSGVKKTKTIFSNNFTFY